MINSGKQSLATVWWPVACIVILPCDNNDNINKIKSKIPIALCTVTKNRLYHVRPPT